MRTTSLILILMGIAGGRVFAAEPMTLKEAYAKDFLIGTALNSRQVFGEWPQELALVERHFNSITPENLLKWEMVHPEPKEYHFEPADRFVEYGERHGMFIVGHTLVWHSQTPRWVFRGEDGEPADRETLLERMREHIHTVMGRYKGRIGGWDVVNEAVEDNGSLRNSRWRRIIGDDYIAKAFEFAREADPEAELYYNDFDMWKKEKRDGVIRLVKDLQARGLRIDGIGMQGHWGLDYPEPEEAEASIEAFAALGVKVMITELDVTVLPVVNNYFGAEVERRSELNEGLNPYPDGLPTEVERQFTKRCAEFFSLFHRHADKISRVTFWGVHDGNSWRNNFPMRGRTDYPLLFDRRLRPKAALSAVTAIPAETTAGRTFTNPVLSGFYPDPSICRVGDDYYMVHSTFEYFPGVPIFHSRDLVQTPAGWWMVCLGIRPQGGAMHHLGRETFLAPVEWGPDGWPTVNGGRGIELVMEAPKLPPHPFPKEPARDEFEGERLGLAWNFLRNPQEENYSLSERPGYLRLKGSAVTMSDAASPTFVGQRQRDLNCTVSAKLDFVPNRENEEAGMVVRGNDQYHYDLGLTLKNGRRQAFFRKVLDGRTIEPVTYVWLPDGEVTFTITASPLSYEFACRTSENPVAQLGNALTGGLSSEKIGGFTGVYIGIYATGNGKASTSPADFDYFEYKAATTESGE